ncbi:DUF4974 domain-containing protein [Hymenobacter jejuensis]|uniref:Secretin/TonB short N-terminal domain-containing protein n=1 Tax=Hymenobacter jejuensis TaxID=2502781 RepID=A0A5B7ZYW7_9BACT|nr:DUF4974 domain-containing protein [Hymenobacter jejuensis]QDA59686.1 hypothetical protein FHG12_06015 [Hymenobacter jejuensis]
MRRILALLFLLGLPAYSLLAQASASVLSRPVQVAADNVPLEQVLRDISRSSDVAFSYSSNFVPLQQRVTLHTAGPQPVGEVLDVLLKETGATYQVIGNQVVLRKRAYTTASAKSNAPVASAGKSDRARAAQKVPTAVTKSPNRPALPAPPTASASAPPGALPPSAASDSVARKASAARDESLSATLARLKKKAQLQAKSTSEALGRLSRRTTAAIDSLAKRKVQSQSGLPRRDTVLPKTVTPVRPQ